MQRALLLAIAAALMAGCQWQNPFAAFGPSRVPAPTTHQTPPYYPPTPTSPRPLGPQPAIPNQRLSVSAEGVSIGPPTRSGTFADPSDRSPIRVVENPQATARLATAAGRKAAESKNSTARPARSAGGSPPAPQNAPPGSTPQGVPQSSYPPGGRAPAFSRTRGDAFAQGATSGGAGEYKADAAVVPASYQQSAPGFVETTAAAGQWRAR